MRAHITGDLDSWEFSETLEKIGNGIIGKNTNGIVYPPQGVSVKNKADLLTSIYPNIEENHKDSNWLSERAILAPRNVEVNEFLYSYVLLLTSHKYPVKFFRIALES